MINFYREPDSDDEPEADGTFTLPNKDKELPADEIGGPEKKKAPELKVIKINRISNLKNHIQEKAKPKTSDKPASKPSDVSYISVLNQKLFFF